MRFDADTVRYVGMVVSLIEGRRVSQEEIVEMLVRAVRQHSMYRRRKIEYVLRYWGKRLTTPERREWVEKWSWAAWICAMRTTG